MKEGKPKNKKEVVLKGTKEKAKEKAGEKIGEAKTGASFFAERTLFTGENISKIKNFSVAEIYQVIDDTVDGYYKVSDPDGPYISDVRGENGIYLNHKEKLDFVYNSNYVDSSVYNAIVGRLDELSQKGDLTSQLN